MLAKKDAMDVVKKFFIDHEKLGVDGAITKYYDTDCMWVVGDYVPMVGIERIKDYVSYLNSTFQRPYAQMVIRNITVDDTRSNAVLVEYSAVYYNPVTGDSMDEYFLSVFEISDEKKIIKRYDGFDYADYRTGPALPNSRGALRTYEEYLDDFPRHVYVKDEEKDQTQKNCEIIKYFLWRHDESEKGFTSAYEEMYHPDLLWINNPKKKNTYIHGKEAAIVVIGQMGRLWGRPYAQMDVRYIGECENGTVLVYWVEHMENRDTGYITPYVGQNLFSAGVWTAFEIKDDLIYQIRSYYDTSTYDTPPAIKFGLEFE